MDGSIVVSRPRSKQQTPHRMEDLPTPLSIDDSPNDVQLQRKILYQPPVAKNRPRLDHESPAQRKISHSAIVEKKKLVDNSESQHMNQT